MSSTCEAALRGRVRGPIHQIHQRRLRIPETQALGVLGRKELREQRGPLLHKALVRHIVIVMSFCRLVQISTNDLMS